jgi:methylated-DNA-[protein]-cysteine S-methyltransferase
MDGDAIMDRFIFSTAFGRVGIIYRQKPFSLVEIQLPMSVEAQKDAIHPPAASLHPGVVSLAESICRYFTGTPINPHWALLDLSHLTPLQQKVLRATAQIPFGQTRSYQDVAKIIHHPGASRFVGNTMARNPFPILIPCHRVIRSDGTYGGFGGGGELKKLMIEHEAWHSTFP